MKQVFKVITTTALMIATTAIPAQSTLESSHASTPSQPSSADTTTETSAPISGAKAYQIESVDQMAPGKLADGYIGDFVLQNSLFRAVIARPDKPQMGEVRGGSLIDIIPAAAPTDYIAGLNTTTNPITTGSLVIYTAATASAPSSESTTASIELTGYVGDPGVTAPSTAVDVNTRYSITPDSPMLQISTTFTNNTTQTAWLQPADRIDWGEAGVFIEGSGYAATTAPAQFIIGSIDDFSLGYFTSGTKALEGYHNARHSVVLARGAMKNLAEKTEAHKAVAGHDDSGLEPQYRGMGARTKPGPGLVMLPGTETRYGSSGLMPVPKPLYVPEEMVQVVDGKATVTSIYKNNRDIFAKSQDTDSSQVELTPGTSFTFTRFLVVSDDDWSPIAARALEEKNIKTTEMTGVVLEMGNDKPVANARVQISQENPDDKKSTPYLQVTTGPDGSFVTHLPDGQYKLRPIALGRFAPSPKEVITVKSGEKQKLHVLKITPQSTLRIAVSQAETATSTPLPAKVSITAKPPFAPINYGFSPEITHGERNTIYMPQGFAVVPLTPGRYRIVISRGLEYDTIEKDIRITAGQELNIAESMPHAMKDMLPGMVSLDAGVMTTASAVGYASPETRVIQAACEGVSVIVSGDYGQATDLQKAIDNLGLNQWIKAFRGRRELLHKDNMSADLFVYPLDDKTNAAFDEALAKTDGLPPDIAIADLRKQFPDLIFEISRPIHPEAGYFNSFPFNESKREFDNDIMPPPDFDTVQLWEGSKLGHIDPIYYRYMDMQKARFGKNPIGKGLPISPVGSSYSRLPHGDGVGYPRAYLYLKQNKTLADVSSEDIRTAVKGQHLLVTNGPILLFDGYDRDNKEFSVIPGEIIDSRTTDVVAIRARVLAPRWVTLQGINTRENGLRGITVFNIRPNNKIERYPTNESGSHIYVRYIKRDSVLDAYCYSTIKSLAPVVPNNLPDFGGEVLPYCFTGPIFVDRDGDGKIIIDDPKE